MDYALLLDFVLLIWGSVILITNFLKPAWYWESARMKLRRETMGDDRISLIYYGLGGIMVTIGVLGRLGYL